MSNKKVSVPIAGKMVEGNEIDYKELKENWNEYKLEDGTVIRMKSVVTRIVKTKEYNKENEPIYYVNSRNILSARVPDKLKKRIS